MHKPVLRAPTLRLLRRTSHPRTPDLEVHFHQGPQGQPAPCYDAHCTRPRLSI